MIAAKELGFFREEKEQVDIVHIRSPQDVESLRDGTVNFCSGTAHAPLLIFPEWRGVKLVAVITVEDITGFPLKQRRPGCEKSIVHECAGADGNLPCTARERFHAANLKASDAQTFATIETGYDSTGYGASVIGITRDSALKQEVPVSDVEAWEKDLRSRTAEGEWFFCLNRFVFTAVK